jgi:hypothetical protein
LNFSQIKNEVSKKNVSHKEKHDDNTDSLDYRKKKLGRDDTAENILFDKRTAGLFKVEYERDGIIALASKMYYCFGGGKDKFSTKGINQKQLQAERNNKNEFTSKPSVMMKVRCLQIWGSVSKTIK